MLENKKMNRAEQSRQEIQKKIDQGLEQFRPEALETFRQREERIEVMMPGFSITARTAVAQAHLHAMMSRHREIASEHLLLGVLEMRDGAVQRLFNRLTISPEILHQELTRRAQRGDKPCLNLIRFADPEYSPEVQRILDNAREEAQRFDFKSVTIVCILSSLAQEGESLAGRVLAEAGVDLEQLRRMASEYSVEF